MKQSDKTPFFQKENRVLFWGRFLEIELTRPVCPLRILMIWKTPQFVKFNWGAGNMVGNLKGGNLWTGEVNNGV